MIHLFQYQNNDHVIYDLYIQLYFYLYIHHIYFLLGQNLTINYLSVVLWQYLDSLFHHYREYSFHLEHHLYYYYYYYYYCCYCFLLYLLLLLLMYVLYLLLLFCLMIYHYYYYLHFVHSLDSHKVTFHLIHHLNLKIQFHHLDLIAYLIQYHVHFLHQLVL